MQIAVFRGITAQNLQSYCGPLLRWHSKSELWARSARNVNIILALLNSRDDSELFIFCTFSRDPRRRSHLGTNSITEH